MAYRIITEVIDHKRSSELRSWASACLPDRGIASDGAYWHALSGVEQPELDIWWARDESLFVEDVLDRIAKLRHNPSLRLYGWDFVFAAPFAGVVNPHVDTPYRFTPWEGADSGLGEQFILALEDLDEFNGATGIVPNSQQYTWPIDQCYSGAYNEFFSANCEQPRVSEGSVLHYDSRALHSTMPNMTQNSRAVMVVNYVCDSVFDEVAALDESRG